jgi:methionyl-tRNA formyltransferase
MNVIVCGKTDAAVECLEWLVDQGDQVWAIAVGGDEGQDGWQRSLRAASQRLTVPCDQPANINDPHFVKRLADFKAHVLVSIQFDQILRQPLFDTIDCPCLNLHFALLPRHRGVAPIAWAVLEGDTETGVTLHHMVEAIDAGDIIAQRSVPISPADTARDVYDKLSSLSVQLFQESYPFSAELLGRRTPQHTSAASYHRQGEFDFSARHIDWSRTAVQLHRWIRAMIFPPFQYPEVLMGRRVWQVTSVSGDLRDEVAVPPGQLVGVTSNAIDVAAGGGVIRVTGLRDPAAASLKTSDLVHQVELGMIWD